MKKKIRKNKKPKPKFSVNQLFKDAIICCNTKGDNRLLFLEACDKAYQDWLVEKRNQGQSVNVTKQIMIKLEEMLGEQNNLRIEADKYKAIDEKFSEKNQDKADEIFSQVKFILDIIGFKQGVNASEFLNPIK